MVFSKLNWEEIRKSIDGTVGFHLASPDESALVYETAVRLQAKEILELGLWLGTFTIPLLYYCKEYSAHLTTVDKNSYPDTMKVIESLGLSNNWECVVQDDTEFAKTWNKPIDLLIIDTSHYYEHTLQELRSFAPFVSKEILMHDVLHPAHGRDEMKAITDFMLEQRRYSYEHQPIRDRIECWQFSVYNTWNGMGRLYRGLGEAGTKSG